MATKNKRKLLIISKLKYLYKKTTIQLNFKTTFELLISTILSAQSKDKQVNTVTNKLFRIANTPEKMYNLPINELLNYIKSIGLYRNKCKYISLTSYKLINDFNGEVPGNKKDLITLPGVGNKTANVVLSNGFNIPAIAVDTHVFRVSKMLGLSNEESINKIEISLQKVFKKKDWITMHNCLIAHGRKICKAIKPICGKCIIKPECNYFKINNNILR